jgi:hypothetical protein
LATARRCSVADDFDLAGFGIHLDCAHLSAMRKGGDREGLVPSGALIEGSRVRSGLAAGGRWIRTIGTASESCLDFGKSVHLAEIFASQDATSGCGRSRLRSLRQSAAILTEKSRANSAKSLANVSCHEHGKKYLTWQNASNAELPPGIDERHRPARGKPILVSAIYFADGTLATPLSPVGPQVGHRSLSRKSCVQRGGSGRHSWKCARPGRWNLASTTFPDAGPMVRIRFPPAESQSLSGAAVEGREPPFRAVAECLKCVC